MRPWRHLLFALNSAWQSFWRNAAVSLAAVLSITLILILAGVNLLLGHALGAVLDTYKARVSVISISVADDTPLATVEEFKARLQSDQRVASVRFISKDEELARFQADPINQQIAQQVEGNPLAAKLEVRVKKLSDVGAIDAQARQWRGADRTEPTDYQGDFIARMLSLASWLTYAGLGILLVLTVVSILFVMHEILTYLYISSGEIDVLKCCGDTVR